MTIAPGRSSNGFLLHIVGTPPADLRDMNVDGSIEEQVYAYVNQTSRPIAWHGFTINIVNTGIQWGNFGGIAALTNGLTAGVFDVSNDEIIDFTRGSPWKRNDEIFSGVGTAVIGTAAGPDRLTAFVTWPDVLGSPVELLPGYSIQVRVRDDLAAIQRMRILITARR
jgi:hypothetical protein